MKKYIISAVIGLLLFSVNSSAQFGITIGGNTSNIKIKEALTDARSLVAGQVGVFYKIGKGNLITFEPGLSYVFASSYDDVLKTNFKTGTLQVPLPLHIGFGIGKLVRLYGIAEPFLGIRMFEDGKFAANKNFKENLTYGAGLGAGVQLFNHVQVNVKYNWSLGYVNNFTIESVKNISQATCNGISLALAFYF